MKNVTMNVQNVNEAVSSIEASLDFIQSDFKQLKIEFNQHPYAQYNLIESLNQIKYMHSELMNSLSCLKDEIEFSMREEYLKECEKYDQA